MADTFSQMQSRMEDLAREQGLDYYPVEFEVVPPSFMMEVAVYGLPVRMPHWSFGVRYIHQLVQHQMGHSRIFEVVYPGNPGRAYMSNNNSEVENTLVCAHVLGHADFAKNNELFRRSQEQVGSRIVDLAAAHAHRITEAIEEYGPERVERVLDAALALEQHVDLNQDVGRPEFPGTPPATADLPVEQFQSRFDGLPGEHEPEQEHSLEPPSLSIPPRPESDLLWFTAKYAPEMEAWERDIFLAVREESFYFYPVFACQIMNEGWASLWHARLLREASFLSDDFFVDAMKTHSDVVRPVAGEKQAALSINPYHLGFSIWDRIVESDGIDAAREIMGTEDDFSFLRNYLSAELIEELGLFVYDSKRDGEIKVADGDADRVREAILAPKFNFGSPRVSVSELRKDGTLVLEHEHETDGRGLDVDRAIKVMEYIHKVWRRPVFLKTLDSRGANKTLEVGT